MVRLIAAVSVIGGLLFLGAKQVNATTSALGLRNNNPGNLRPEPGDVYTWNGEVGVNKGYLVFDEMENGVRAAYINLRSYFRNGFNTVEKIIARWAPREDDNDTEAYIQFVEDRLNVSRGQKLYFNEGVGSELLKAIFYVENGGWEIPRRTLDEGITRAL